MASNGSENQPGAPPPGSPKKSSPRGYYALAREMTIADNELAIYRNFKHLNALCLLHLQAELVLLSGELDRLRESDDAGPEEVKVIFPGEGDLEVVEVDFPRQLFSSCFADMQQVARDDPQKCLQYEKLIQIRAKLREYNDLLLQFSNVCKLEKPDDMDLLTLKEWILGHRRINKPDKPFLKPSENGAYFCSDDPDNYVLVQKPNPEKDIIPHFILTLYHKLFNKKLQLLKQVKDEEGQIHYMKSNLIVLGNWMAPILSSILLILAILVLYYIPSTPKKLYTMMPLTVLFSVAVKAFTSATRAEIFVAVAGFVAVEVVFISTNNQ